LALTQYTKWSGFRNSFQFRLFTVFTLLTACISILLTTLYVFSEIHEKRNFTRDNVHLLAQQLAESVRLPLYAENSAILQQYVEQTVQIPEICAVVISGPNGRVLANAQRPDQSGSAEIIRQTVEVYSSRLIDSVESSMTGSSDGTRSLLGTVRIERGTADLSRAIRRVVLLSVCSAIAFWLTVSLFCYLALRRVTRSFNALMHGIHAMEEGDFSCRINITSNDEPGRAAHAVNHLATALQLRSEDNIRLQEERMELERQMLHAQKLESLGIMAGGIAHDFNNLLQSMLGNMELSLNKLPQDSTPFKYIANAMNSGKHAAHLTGLMLTYVGRGYITKKELSLNELVRDNADMLRTAATTAVSTELRLAAELPAILADRAQIQQVVMNLIANAAESIVEQPGFVTLTTGLQSCDQFCLAASIVDEKPEPGLYVFLEVGDNGCGMDEETIKRIFDPFFTTKFTGRGLGMSAVLGIVRTHRGAMFMVSEPGKGTRIKVLFPAAESARLTANPPAPYIFLRPDLPLEKEETDKQPEQLMIPEIPLSGVALVVDDEKSVLKVCTKMVSLCGYRVITASDGIDAVSKFRENGDEIALVLMDLTMPNMDGIAAMNEIYSIRPDARVILASGFNEDELTLRITEQAPSGFIRKPYSLGVLETEIRRVVQSV
jgi:signal transduction histidine kinase/CheY-like chemotaxis protein